MQTNNRILDDVARLMSGALGSLSGVKTEIDTLVRHRLERLLADMQLVHRDEFEAVKAVAANARAAQEALEARVAALESALQAVGASGSKGSGRKSTGAAEAENTSTPKA